MNSANRATLAAIFARPTRSDIRWASVEALIKALGGKVEEREGSRVVLKLGERRAVLHRPYPSPTARKAAIDAVRVFLVNAGIKP